MDNAALSDPPFFERPFGVGIASFASFFLHTVNTSVDVEKCFDRINQNSRCVFRFVESLISHNLYTLQVAAEDAQFHGR
jgi:hypothetical protein